MSKVLIDRALLERAVYGLELAYETNTPAVRDICAALSVPQLGACGCTGLCEQRGLASDEVGIECKAVYGPAKPPALAAPSGTPVLPVKAYYHETPNEYGGLNKSVGLEVRKEFTDAPLVLESDAMARIACLEGEIAKRDARIAELEARYRRDVYGLNNEGDPIGGDPAGGYANDNARLRSELAAIKAQEPVRYWFIGDAGQEKGSRHCKKSSSCGSLAFFESELDAKNAAQRHHGTEVYAVDYYAAPAATAADAGLVEALEMIINPIEAMRRELQVGEQLNGMVAMQLASDPEYLRGVAKAALAAHRAKGVV